MNRFTKLLSIINSKTSRRPIVITTVLTVVMIAFQNCASDVEFSARSKSNGSISGGNGTNPAGALTINKGVPYTNNTSVRLDIETYRAIEMALVNGGCPDQNATFEPIVNLKDWNLNDQDGKSNVGMILRDANGVMSDCISADITLDRQAPTVGLLGTYAKAVPVTSADFKMEALDELSGVDKIYCYVDGLGSYKECTLDEAFKDLKEGSRQFTAYVTDKAGNSSDILNYSWLIDLTAPTAEIVDPKPAPVSIVNTVNFYFEGKDIDGSGLQKFVCYLDDKSIGDCTSPTLLKDLADGNHKFSVVSIDNVNWTSKAADYAFMVDTSPSGDFQILGVKSTKTDDKLDNYVSDDGYPVAYWTASLGAQSYVAKILSQDKSRTVCGPVTVKGDVLFATFDQNCNLPDAGSYYVAVSAFKNTLETKALDFSFQVDLSAPVITVKNIVKDDEKKTATVYFSVADDTSGVQTATCYKKYNTDTKTDDCLDKSSISYDMLSEGDHSFYITASDKLGHTATSTPVTFKIQYVVCDPFKLVEGKCQRGLKAQLYYASAADRLLGNSALNTKFNTVSKLIAGGILSNTIIYLPFLDVRTRSFTSGFSTTENTFLKDDSGKLLDEWFALDMETIFKLGPNDTAGYYQMISISDDGSNVLLQGNTPTTYRTYINDDGIHSTKVGCTAANDYLNMDANSRVSAKVQYYQGPRTEIAMSLFWRKVTSANSPLSQYCGKTSANGVSIGSAAGYQLLLDEGFKPLTGDNFILKEAVAP